MSVKPVVITLALLALVGCHKATPPYASEANAYASDASYMDGYREGCESGHAYGKHTHIKSRDYGRQHSDKSYFLGWDEGFTNCRFNIYKEPRDHYHHDMDRVTGAHEHHHHYK